MPVRSTFRKASALVFVGLWSGAVLAKGSYGVSAYPSTVLERHGVEGKPVDDTCCQTRLIGWNAEGQIATYSSVFLPEEDSYRFGVDLQDLVNDQPRELFSIRLFRGDDTLGGRCRRTKDPLRCVWNDNNGRINGALTRAGFRGVTGAKLLPLPPFEIRWTADGDPEGQGSAPFSMTDSGGRLVFQMPDTSTVGIHLVPAGVLHSTSPRARFLLLKMLRRDIRDDIMTDVGVRFVRWPDSQPVPSGKSAVEGTK